MQQHQQQMQEYIKNILGSGTATLIILNYDMKGMIKIVKFLEDSGQILKRVNETIQNEAKEEAGEFLSILIGTLGLSLLGKMLAGKE